MPLHPAFLRVLLVFAGGGIGACLRALLLTDRIDPTYNLVVLGINLGGSCALGVVFVLADEAQILNVETRLFTAVGILGGLTTFSTFGWDLDLLLARHNASTAALFALAGTAGALIAVGIGIEIARACLAMLGHERMRESTRDPHMLDVIETEDRDRPA